MSAISIETKKVTELTAFTTPTDSCLIPIHDGTGLKKITFANFRAKAVEVRKRKSLLCSLATPGRTMQFTVASRWVAP
jgi:hypothetical protein